ncbi:MAG: ABC transporter substrate-binding protein [Saprospiraceae bacterium]|nr:ABC transporter substrate-binding protein [Saprospiraceae bacterium]
MISVQNLLQPLNGSKESDLLCVKEESSEVPTTAGSRQNAGLKMILGMLSLCFLMSSCALFQPVTKADDKDKEEEELDPISGRRVYDPETGTYIEVKDVVLQDMDTIIWTDVPASAFPPITASDETYTGGGGSSDLIRVDDLGSEFLSTYNVALVLPLLTDRFNEFSTEINESAMKAINYYGGVQLALDQLRDEDISLNISVLDTKASTYAVNTLLRSNQEIRNSNLIIGPFLRDNINLVADWVKQNDKVMVSPYSAAAGLVSKTPEYVQVNPSLRTHTGAILEHALANYRQDQIVLVSKDVPAERARLQYFQEEFKLRSGLFNAPPLQEFIISDESADLANMEVLPFIEIQDTTVFIVPNWDEAFVYALLRKIDSSKLPEDEVIVYGMPQWMRFQRLEFDYYEKLNVHISSNSYINPLSNEVRSFKQRFFDKFGSIPTYEAYIGYDVMLYFSRMMKKYGTKFHLALEREPTQMMHTRFNFERVVAPASRSGADLFDTIEQFENKYVNILKFEDFQFQLAN